MIRFPRPLLAVAAAVIAAAALASAGGSASAADGVPATGSTPTASPTPVPTKAPVVDADPASGNFTYTTANGILPTWTTQSIRITGISPGSAITDGRQLRARVTIPIVGTKGSANFAAGGFRLTNIDTGDYVNCATPVIDTKAKVIDCVVAGTNRRIFAITKLGIRSSYSGPSFTTTTWKGLELRVANTAMADYLNETLEANTFSPSVIFANAQLTVTQPR